MNWIELFRIVTRPRLTGEVNGKRIVLDGLRIINARLVDCTLVYGGGGFHLIDSEVKGGHIELFGAASNTLALMKHLENKSPGALESTFRLAFWKAKTRQH